MDEQPKDAMEAIAEFLVAVARLTQIAKEQKQTTDVLQNTLSLLIEKWLPERERIEREHQEDIEALKNAQEFIGKTISGLKKENAFLKHEIEFLKSKIK